MILSDSILKDIDGWRHNKRLKSTEVVGSLSRATTNGMPRHTTDCLIHSEPDKIVLNHRINSFSKNLSPDDITNNIIRLATST